ncbi:MAG: hypothetical protein Tsb0015_12680 [Simkaniaceae bacterium]
MPNAKNRVLEHLFLSFLFFKIKKDEFFRQRFVKKKYYKDLIFKKIDKELLANYWLRNPYKISKHFFLKKGAKDVHTYGETPLSTMEKILLECQICPEDVFFELGAGRGRCSFFMAHFAKCRVFAIEQIPEFVFIANRIVKDNQLKNIAFLCQDIKYTNLHSATVIFLYGLCMEEKFLNALIKRLENLRPGTKIITVSYPLSTLGEFETVREFEGEFPWGKTKIYLNLVKTKIS